MSSADQASEKNDVVANATPPADAPEALAQAGKDEKDETKEAPSVEASEDTKDSEPITTETAKPADTAESGAEAETIAKDESTDVEMKDATEDAPATAEPDAEEKEEKEEEYPAEKAKTPRRKSTGGSESKGKKLNRKQSKARILNLNAQPGDHFLVKLKGFPPWPAVVCDEDMLPGQIITSRPVTAKRADGTYRDDFDDGGKRVNDRTFPVMYLHTNEFGWVPNTSLQELSPDQASAAINDKMRKDLQSAYELASENHDLDFYKEVLQQFQEELVAKEEAQKARKNKASMIDEMDIESVDRATPVKKSKKRKADDDVATPQRSDSVKKPKIKLTGSSAKAAANGAATSKTTKDQSASKSKAKRSVEKQGTPVAKRAEMTPKERHERRVKEVYYLRHRLQRGLFPKGQGPKPEDMPAMADFFTKLEAFTEMDASILRATRIHKLPKAILRLESIPREEEFNFKSRSSGLLQMWNKMLADTPPPVEGGTPAGANGAGGDKEKAESKTGTNGSNQSEAKATSVERTESKDEDKDEGKDEDKVPAEEEAEAGSEEENKTPAAVEATA